MIVFGGRGDKEFERLMVFDIGECIVTVIKEMVMKPGELQRNKQITRFMLEGPRPCTIFCFVLTHFG